MSLTDPQRKQLLESISVGLNESQRAEAPNGCKVTDQGVECDFHYAHPDEDVTTTFRVLLVPVVVHG